jgi:hypothetical protein
MDRDEPTCSPELIGGSATTAVERVISREGKGQQ